VFATKAKRVFHNNILKGKDNITSGGDTSESFGHLGDIEVLVYCCKFDNWENLRHLAPRIRLVSFAARCAKVAVGIT
jgi:hypothetical protein